MAKRTLILPARGTLLVSTDLHGNLEDWRRLKSLFLAATGRDPATHWVILGDLVHGPDDRARARDPVLCGFPDDSWTLCEELTRLMAEHAGRVHFVLGNHDYGHIGGPHPGKFHLDEVEFLEQRLSAPEREAIRALFRSALLAVAAPCGVLLAHGSPDDSLDSLDELDAIDLPPPDDANRQHALVDKLLTSYGQHGEVTQRLLEKLSRDGLKLTMVVHGHDRDEAGIFVEGDNQVCPVIFGAPREAKCYLKLDLAMHYEGPGDLRPGVEVLRLNG